jgi:thioredoxin-related protein
MKIFLGISLLILMSVPAVAQRIKQKEFQNWNQVTLNSKKIKKYIFVDLYATWCLPCKKMDAEVYNNPSIASELNASFVFLKLQMDRTRKDNAYIKKWYTEVASLASKFQVNSVPIILIFSPSGLLLKKQTGFVSSIELLRILKDVQKSNAIEFYHSLDDYNSEKIKNYGNLLGLIDKAKMLSMDDKLIKHIALDFKERYLNSISVDSLYNRKYLSFLIENSDLIKSNDNAFNVFFNNGEHIDSLIKLPGVSQIVVNDVIRREEIGEKINTKLDSVNWNEIEKSILIKYGEKYLKTLSFSKKDYYRQKGNWTAFSDQRENILKKYSLDKNASMFDPSSPSSVNTDAWDVFVHCNDSVVLNRALNWIALAIQTRGDNEQYWDTKANLLYKLGRVEEAIATEKEAINVGKNRMLKLGIQNAQFKDFEDVMIKMNANQKTWK